MIGPPRFLGLTRRSARLRNVRIDHQDILDRLVVTAPERGREALRRAACGSGDRTGGRASGLNQSGSGSGVISDRLGRVIDNQLDLLNGPVLQVDERREPVGRFVAELEDLGLFGLVPAEQTRGSSAIKPLAVGFGLTGGMASELITSPGFSPALLAGESGRTATMCVLDRIAEPETRDVDGLVCSNGSLGPGRSVVGRHGQRLRLALAAAGIALDLEGHRLAGAREAQARQLHGVEVVLTVELDDPISLAEARPCPRANPCGCR